MTPTDLPDTVGSVTGRGDLLNWLEEVGNQQDEALPMADNRGFVSLGDAVFRSMYKRWGDITIERKLAVADFAPDHQLRADAAIERGLPLCESAIERLMLPWLVCQEYQHFRRWPAVLLPGEQADHHPLTVAVIPQLPIGKYRVDFALAASRGGLIRFVVVECDGRDFHDAPEQVAKDEARDAELRKNERVMCVVRIPGWEIMKDPKAAAGRAARELALAWEGRPPSR